ncbi:MAG: 4-nitrophenyl phosphatase [Fusobacteria bacterium]|nr:MAG: 4-nitrophenyl phosphatase [Fusobacteriota bacterium]KAF0229212.1 MAG: 4-nitrophenyl [Fusobacteriota bacterium]
MLDLNSVRGILIDIDGTLMRGKELLDGALEFLEYLDNEKITYLIVSNNTKSPNSYVDLFKARGVWIREEQILTCTSTTKRYLDNNTYIKSAYVIGKPDLFEAVEAAGVRILEDASGVDIGEVADAVIVGGDFELNYTKLKDAVLHLQKGAVLIGSNGDMLIPTEEGLVPEAGMTLAALEAGSGIKPIILGKPEPYFFKLAVEKLSDKCEDESEFDIRESIVMLGDRLDTDISGAAKYGLKTILVKTGVDDELGIEVKKIYPDLVVEDLVELKNMWRRSKENGK